MSCFGGQFPPNLLACSLRSKAMGLGEVWGDVLWLLASPALVPPSPALVPPSPAPVLSPFVQMLHVLAAQFLKATVGREGRNFTKVHKNKKETWRIPARGGLE